MSQQPAVKMSAAALTAEALESAAGMLEGRQRKLESMIRDPRSPVNVESLLVRGRPGRAAGGSAWRGNKGSAALAWGGREGEGRKGLPRPGRAFLGEDEGSFPGGEGARRRSSPLPGSPARGSGHLRGGPGGRERGGGALAPGGCFWRGGVVWRGCGVSQRSLFRYNSLRGK